MSKCTISACTMATVLSHAQTHICLYTHTHTLESLISAPLAAQPSNTSNKPPPIPKRSPQHNVDPALPLLEAAAAPSAPYIPPHPHMEPLAPPIPPRPPKKKPGRAVSMHTSCGDSGVFHCHGCVNYWPGSV